ncbi:transcription factor TFIIIB component B'' homolog isoform X3 [Polyodon spathula]|uniref:transcription factor TFIIIB component B'' homolog isoform X3 n=1 Tax=Polyodon spathula TaxID=7913 RepID=UPI001B7EC788|nr:transcription factor TFIIIB component B'' homolog isoform X3 [Polyodon spathula]
MMIRRSRISVRPNVRPGGRGLSSSSQEPKPAAEAPPGSPKAQEKRDVAGREPQDEAPPPPPLTEDTQVEQQASLNQEEKNYNGKASGNSVPPAAPIQRRKRISAMPNLAKPRTVAPQARTPRPATTGTAKNKEPTPKDRAVLENTAPQTLPKSPGRRRTSTPQLKVPDKKSGNLKELKTAPASQEPAADSNQSRNDETQQTHSESSPKLKTPQDSFCIDDHRPSSPGKLKASQNDTCVNDHHPHPEYSQGKLKDSQNSTCIEEKQRPPEYSLPLRKSTASLDRERIIKARKLRELLKKEIRKEKKQQKGKIPDFEFITPVDRSKMTMRDFIYYLPENNPMTSSLEEERREIEKVIGPMPSKDPANKAPLRPPVRDEDEDDHEEEDVEHVQDDQVLVPRVKVAEDGSIIIDEESLTVEVLRTQGPNVVEENDPVFERGSTTTYSSFRKSTHTKPWTNRETDMFFLAISMVGTDFSIIGQLFPHRARVEIKNKFKREERENSWRIDKAFKEKRPFDFEFFSQLLERILKDDERKRLNKNKVTLGKKPANPKWKKKEKKADQDKALDGGGSVEVSDSEVAEGDADAETTEKENEDSLNVNEGEASAAGGPDAKKKRKRKNDAESSGPATKKPSEDSPERQQKKAKKRKRIKSVENHEDNEEVDYENMPPLEGSPGSSPCRREDPDTPEVPAQIKKQQIAEEEDVSGPAEETAGPEAAETPRLAQRSQLQKPKPCLRLATKTGAKAAVDKPNELSQASHFISHGQAAEPHCVESATEGTAASHLKRSTAGDKRPSSDMEEEEEHDITAIQQKMLQKPTRSGRIPKFSLHLKQPEDDEPPEASPPASPPPEAGSPQRRGRGRPPQSQKAKPSALKGRDQKKDPRPGKTALVTLRASVKETEENSDEGEPVMEEEDSFPVNPEEVNQAPAFVPVSLRSPAPVPAQVEETMEELEVSVSVPDTRCAIEAEHLHHSDSVCSQSLDQSPAEAAVTENCLHLLVDVIEVSTSEKDEDNSLPVNDSSTDSDRSWLAVKKDLVCQPSSAAGPGENGSGISEEPPCQALKPGLVEVEKAAAVSQDSMQPAHSQAVTCEATTQVLHETPSETPGEETAGRAQALRDPCTLEEAANTTGVVNAPEVSCGSETPSPNQERGRRSRFPKPKPNLGGKTAQRRNLETKPAQSDSGQDSCGKGDASRKAEVHIIQQKPAEEKESEVNSCKDEEVSEELREVKASSLSSSVEGLRKDGTDIVVNAPEVSYCSETPSQNQERCRTSRFPKPKPNLGGKTVQRRNLETKPTQSDSGQDSCGDASSSPAVDIAPHHPVDEKKCDSSRDEGVAEKLGDRDSSSCAEGLKQDNTNIPALESLPEPTGEDERVEKKPAKPPVRRPKPNLSGKLRIRIPPEKNASTAASTGQEQNAIPEDGTVSTLDSPVSKEAEVRSPKADEKPSTSVISQNTEGSLAANEFPQQEPTFILTLFEIPPSLLGDYDDSTSSLSTVSAELLSSPVFVDHMPAELPETQSLVSEAVEVESYSMSGCTEDAGIVSLDQFSQPVYRSGEEEKPRKELPATLAHVKDLTTDLGEEEYVSITLEPVEDFPAAAEADSAETSNGAAQQSRQKNKPPGRPRSRKHQVKPNTSKKKPPVSTGACGTLKVVHVEPQERLLSAETASCAPLPQPAEEHSMQERPLSAETASCTPLPQPAEEHSTQEECSQHEGEEASNSSVKADEPSIENTDAGEDLTSSTANTLPPSATPLIRPGRKPKGFLSFISQKSSSDNSPKPRRTTFHKPQINTTGLDRKRTASAPAVDLSSKSSAGSPPSAGMRLCASRSSTPVAERVGTASSQLIHFPMTESCSSESRIEEVFCTKNSAADEEPTSISQYFFSDIFTEVDDTD